MAKRSWPRMRYWTCCIAVCFLASPALADGQEADVNKNSTRAGSRLRRFFSGFESKPIPNQAEAANARWANRYLRGQSPEAATPAAGYGRFTTAPNGYPMSDGAVRRTQGLPPTPDPSGGAPSGPVDLGVPAADRAIGGGQPTTAGAPAFPA